MNALPAADGVPVLSRGKHHSPRRGACFMEYASFLAGEQWSDHPSCTHPLLAQVARRVNDLIGDEGRQQLAPLIPLVVGRRGDDRTWIRLPVAVAAAPILDVPEATQRALAAGLLSARRVCTETGPDLAEIGHQAGAALDLVPGAVAWLERLPAPTRISQRVFANRCAPTMIRCAAEGIVASGTSDRDARLQALLETAIAACPAQPRMGRVANASPEEPQAGVGSEVDPRPEATAGLA